MSELALGQIKGLSVNSNKVTVPAGHTLYAPGHVIQTINVTYGVDTVTTSTSPVNTGLTATITPKSTSSKILVTITQNGVLKEGGQGGMVNITAYRDTTALYQFGRLGYNNQALNNYPGSAAATILDSPATTSAVTYKTMFYGVDSSSIRVNFGGAVSMITLQEIAA